MQYIAKFKRSTSTVATGKNVTIDLDGGFGQCDNTKIKAVYRDYRSDIFDRDSDGYGDYHYTDNSGRNDIVKAKVVQDGENLYFYVQTADDLTPSTDTAWMTLFLNVNGEKEGYDFCVNRTSPACGKTTVEAAGENGWESIGDADIRFEGNQLMLRVPKALLGFDENDSVSFTFKWADNYEDGNIMSFYTKGDSAPYGRLNWVFASPCSSKK